MNAIERLEIYTSTSRGAETYGYTIRGLVCNGKRWRTCGGGYDMTGTVVADYFSDTHQDALAELVKANTDKLVDCNYSVPGYLKIPEFYGLTISPAGEIRLDGGCGMSSIQKIIEACGFEMDYSFDYRRGTVTAYYLQKTEG